jgi:hypothetical protein
VSPILQSFVPDGSLSTNEPVWKDFIHFLPGVAGASANFDGNGPYTRTLIGAGTNTLSLGTNVPLLGQLVGTAPPGNGSIQGARPTWVGALKPSDFRPDVSCASQPVPSLASPTAASDAKLVHTSAAPRLTLTQLTSEFDRAAKRAGQ